MATSKPKEDKTETALEDSPIVDASNQKTNEQCWNCKNHGKKNYLDTKGNCEDCGFTKDSLYNAKIEEDKANRRAAQ
jgi:ribosomal protein L37E